MSGLIGRTNFCREISIEEIQETIEAFGEAARRVSTALSFSKPGREFGLAFPPSLTVMD